MGTRFALWGCGLAIFLATVSSAAMAQGKGGGWGKGHYLADPIRGRGVGGHGMPLLMGERFPGRLFDGKDGLFAEVCIDYAEGGPGAAIDNLQGVFNGRGGGSFDGPDQVGALVIGPIVPEPMTIVLLGLGGLVFCRRGRRLVLKKAV